MTLGGDAAPAAAVGAGVDDQHQEMTVEEPVPASTWDAYWQGVGQVFLGYGDAAVGAVKGAWSMSEALFIVQHRPDLVLPAVGSAVAHPVQTIDKAVEVGEKVVADVKEKAQNPRGQGELAAPLVVGLGFGVAAALDGLTAAAEAEVVNVAGNVASSEAKVMMEDATAVEGLETITASTAEGMEGAAGQSRFASAVETATQGGIAPRGAQPVKVNTPGAYLDEAVAQQGLSKAPAGGLKQKWSEGGYDYEVRVHPAEPTHGKQGSIYRVARRSQAVDANGQGTGWEYLDSNGQWHPESTLKPGKPGYPNPKYNDQAARDTHHQL